MTAKIIAATAAIGTRIGSTPFKVPPRRGVPRMLQDEAWPVKWLGVWIAIGGSSTRGSTAIAIGRAKLQIPHSAPAGSAFENVLL